MIDTHCPLSFPTLGFQHSSFTFSQESGVTRTTVAATKIPSGSLIAHLQRALNYVQAEINLTEVIILNRLSRESCSRLCLRLLNVLFAQDGRPADPEDLDAIPALSLIDSVQPDIIEQRRGQLRSRIRESQRRELRDTGETSLAPPGLVARGYHAHSRALSCSC